MLRSVRVPAMSVFLILATAPAMAGDTAPAPLLGGPVLITEVLYYASSGMEDEFVTLVNTAGASVDLTGWTLTDGEGTLSLPSRLLAPGEALTVAENSTAYALERLQDPDYSWSAGTAPRLPSTGVFQLSNTGDAVTLLDGLGSVVDAVVWGAAVYTGPGWTGTAVPDATRGEVLTRANDGSWIDTDTAADWARLAPRIIGQSDFPMILYAVNGTVEAFASPGRSLEVLVSYLDAAETSIRLSVYQLTSLPLRDALLRADVRGVAIQVLLDGGPVGGIDERGWGIAGNLSAAGIEVRFLDEGNRTGYAARYQTLHAKYAVLDEEITIVSSENWGETGWPPFGTSGNRGWSVAVSNTAVAAHLTAVFDADFDPARLDSIPYAAMAVAPAAYVPEPAGTYVWTVEPLAFSGEFDVTPVIGPENSFDEGAILGLMRSARERLYIEQFYAHKSWDGGPNLFLEEAVRAARRGVEVKVLLDATFYNRDPTDPNDNDDTVANLTAVAASEDLPLEAKLADPAVHDVVKYHNKGIVVDGERVLVSSFNWNLFSPSRNREVGLIVDSPAIGGFFESRFLHDWSLDWTPPTAVICCQERADVNEAFALVGTGSTDDVAVTNWSWDLDGDGDFDAYGSIVQHRLLAPGNYTVRLVARDAWGNAGEERHTIEAVIPPAPPPPTTNPELPWVLLLLASVGFALLLLLSFVYRRGKR